ncbi:dihydropteroate synthase [Sulfuriroseicoccus oceanibius]|uniref:dihydropteroate synthase n=2 Tax=Sulfuriroseicoccus oceanibius TaxID=2707525 RepID=A0A6B3L4D8_9BACT|nr:dihydropteroate synthase [Sulfuriroseicoccus oceanibius]
MGILNVTDDSFCNDGTLDPEEAVRRARRMVADGAGIIDVGAESARTNREPITVEEEIVRLRGFLVRWQEVAAAMGVDERPLVAINTWRPDVVEAINDLDWDLLNDIGGLEDDANARLCAAGGRALLIMHTTAAPKVAQTHRAYDDVMAALDAFFAARIESAVAAGVPRGALVLDPGIDFAKQREDNLTLLKRFGELTAKFAYPWLLPVSRKSVIGRVLDLPDATTRDAGTIALIEAGIAGGAAIFRMHNVPAGCQAVATLCAVRDFR